MSIIFIIISIFEIYIKNFNIVFKIYAIINFNKHHLNYYIFVIFYKSVFYIKPFFPIYVICSFKQRAKNLIAHIINIFEILRNYFFNIA